MAKFWSFKNISNDPAEEEIELRIEGEIIDDDYAWLYEWFGIPATSPNNFREELNQYKGKSITVWIDSYGGSVYAAAGIYNTLMEHKRTGAKVTAKVTKAMSAATVIMMAADERLMSPVGIFMMHNPLPGEPVYGYAADLRKVADVLDEVKETIINAYQLGTGRSRAKISSMMDNETYMNAKTAVKEGFATGMMYAGKEEPPVDDGIMNFGFSRVLAVQNNANTHIQKFFELPEVKSLSALQAPGSKPQPAANINQNQEGDNLMPFKTVDELRNACPELVKQIEDTARDAGRTEERERLKAIDDIAKNVDTELVNKAKYTEPMNAEKLAFEAIKSSSAKGQQYLDDAAGDSNASGSNGVPAAPKVQGNKKDDEAAAVNAVAEAANRKRGIK